MVQHWGFDIWYEMMRCVEQHHRDEKVFWVEMEGHHVRELWNGDGDMDEIGQVQTTFNALCIKARPQDTQVPYVVY